MNSRLIAGLATGACMLAAAPAALAGPTVSVRIEGEAATLLPRTTVTLPDTPAPQNNCPADSAANAVEVATNGNWDRQAFVQTILGETHKFDDNDYWSFWVERGGRYIRGNAICDQKLQDGDVLLGHFDVFAPPEYLPTHLPLRFESVPRTVTAGRPFDVVVARYGCETSTCDPGESRRVSAEGTVLRIGSRQVQADANGKATITLPETGELELSATHPNGVRVAAAVCSTTGSDGLCGSQAPEAGPAAGTGTATVAPDRTGPEGRIAGIAQNQVFGLDFGPRELKGTVAADPAGIKSVKLRLIRRTPTRCFYFSGRRERFVKSRCGRAFYFEIGTRADWSYLLPERLPRGYYALQVLATDGIGNRDNPNLRGRSLIEFKVK